MLKILWKRGKIAPEEQFLPLSTIFYYLMLDFYVKTGIRFSLRDKRLFEITEVEITRVDCSWVYESCQSLGLVILGKMPVLTNNSRGDNAKINDILTRPNNTLFHQFSRLFKRLDAAPLLFLGPVVQSILSLTSSLRGKSLRVFHFITKYTEIFG